MYYTLYIKYKKYINKIKTTLIVINIIFKNSK